MSTTATLDRTGIMPPDVFGEAAVDQRGEPDEQEDAPHEKKGCLLAVRRGGYARHVYTSS